MRLEKPKFMENEEWYYKDKENPIYLEDGTACFRLTEKAPKEAIESYLEYCNAFYSFNLHYIPDFVNEDYRKHMSRFEK